MLTLALVAAAAYQAIPETVRQGDTLRLSAEAQAATARMDGRTVRLFPQAEGGVYGLMPVAVEAKPGGHQVEFLDQQGGTLQTVAVTVRDARFPVQNVSMSRQTAELTPAPGESETVSAFRETVSETRYWQEPLAAPLAGCMVSPFGVRRAINGRLTGDFHAGIDQRSAAGRPVRAVADGVVRIARQFRLRGGTVAIDHGQGLESIYMHQSGFAVQEGAAVKKGDVIGYVGSTGRSTAPHLHWSLYANGVPVNPRQWVTLVPCTARKKAGVGKK